MPQQHRLAGGKDLGRDRTDLSTPSPTESSKNTPVPEFLPLGLSLARACARQGPSCNSDTSRRQRRSDVLLSLPTAFSHLFGCCWGSGDHDDAFRQPYPGSRMACRPDQLNGEGSWQLPLELNDTELTERSKPGSPRSLAEAPQRVVANHDAISRRLQLLPPPLSLSFTTTIPALPEDDHTLPDHRVPPPRPPYMVRHIFQVLSPGGSTISLVVLWLEPRPTRAETPKRLYLYLPTLAPEI